MARRQHRRACRRRSPFELIAGGRSNLTFRATDAKGVALVVRRPPLGHVLASAHDMGREHRLISAVGTTNVPVPPALGLCTDESVNGAPFYVMGFVDGVVLDTPDKAEVMDRRDASGRRLPPDRRPRRSPRRRCRRRRARRPRPPRRVRRAAAQAVVDPVGQLEDARAAGDRRDRAAAARAHPRAAGHVDRPRRLPPRQLPRRTPPPARSTPCSTGSCARSVTRWPTSATSACTGPTTAGRPTG